MNQAVRNTGGAQILVYFILFFGLIAAVNGIFIYVAVNTHTGVITERPYEKGLEYNRVLEKARMQPALIQTASYEKGMLRWQLADETGGPLEAAEVIAHITRPVQSGHDFNIRLENRGGGLYEAAPDLPFRGQWLAELSCAWDDKKYQTALTFIVP